MKIIRISALWCSSCIATYPIWQELKKKYPNIEFQELDYDMDDISKYEVGEILPVIILEKNGKVERLFGEKKLTEIIEKIEEMI